jgi:hypothetical protein
VLDVSLLFIALLPVVLAVAVDETSDRQNFNHTTAFVTGFAFLLALQVFLAEHEVLVGRWLVFLFWMLALVTTGLRSISLVRSMTLRFVARFLLGVGLVFSGFTVWLWPYLRFAAVRRGAPFSNANNDLAIYVMSGDNFLNAGFKEFGRVVGYQAGALANFEVAGSSSLIATVSRFTQQSIWRSTNLSMLILIALTTIGIYVLLRRWSMPILIALPAAVWTISASYARLPQQNYFLSQIISRLALVLALIGIDQVIRKDNRTHQVVGSFVIAIATWLSMVSYPAGSISSAAVLIGAIGAYFLSMWFSKTISFVSLKKLLIIVISFALPLPLLLGRWSLITSNVSLYSKTNITGWPASTSSVSEWIGVSVFADRWTAVLITSLMLVMFVLSLIRLRTTQQQEAYLGLFILLSIASAYLLLAITLGHDAYQVWKFLATVQPLALCGLLVFVVSSLKNQTFINGKYVVRGIATGLIALVGINIIRSSDTYRSNIQFPSMELEVASKNQITRTPNLLIRMNPYLETMIAPVILDLHDALYASDTYLGPASPDDPRCAISRTEDAASVEVAKGLYVGPVEACG